MSGGRLPSSFCPPLLSGAPTPCQPQREPSARLSFAAPAEDTGQDRLTKHQEEFVADVEGLQTLQEMELAVALPFPVISCPDAALGPSSTLTPLMETGC